MCDPISIGMAGLSAISKASAINAQNQAHVANAANALEANNNEIEQSTEQYIEQQRSLIQGGFDAILEGRDAESIAYTSAIENGVQGNSLKAILRDQAQTAGRNAVRNSQEMGSLRRQTGANFDHITAKTKGRISSVSSTKWTLGDTASVLAPIVRSQMD